MNIDHTAGTVAAQDLNGAFVGRTFSYETTQGFPVFGRVAFIEIKPTEVLLTLDGVLHEGSSVVMTLAPTDELSFSAVAG
ncbi:hypothetical protein [Streptomyces sp. NBC_01190]|uniref:hypothetical protein n=1 Tax=Streptomyces sp. NBC_01190 TaxID=2903767 RepID=UPI00386A4D07|nr:hypothetical protein OG519_15085 [Streptomyces sp. NBC_01190]